MKTFKNIELKNSPKISLVLPCYNSEEFIEETLLSIKNQDYKNIELVIVDGGSTDNTCVIIEKYSDLYTRFISESDNGQTDAINKGINFCTGDIFYWINADDFIEKNVLLEVAEEFIKDPFDVLCVRNRNFENGTNRTLQYSKTTFYSTIEETIPYAAMSITVFYNLKKAKTLFPLSESLHYAMDFELYFGFLLKFDLTRARYSTIPIVTNFRVHPDSKTIQQEQSVGYTDLNAIHLSILKQLNAPIKLINYYEKLGFNKFYNKKWDLSAINSNLLYGYYAKRLALFEYSKQEYKNSKELILIAYKSKAVFEIYDWYRFIVLYFMPESILKLILRVKKKNGKSVY
ncbi:MAG: glycosyltransferase [Bacteroidota bacterium]